MLSFGNSNKLSFGNWENYFLHQIKANGITFPLSQLSDSARKKYLSEPEGDDPTYKAKAYVLDAALRYDAFLKEFRKHFVELENFSKTKPCEILEVSISQDNRWTINLIELASCLGPVIKLVDSSSQLIGFVEFANNHVRITTEKPIQIEGGILLKSLHIGSTNHVQINVDLHLAEHLIICASSATIPESVDELNIGGIVSILTSQQSKICPKKISNKCSPNGTKPNTGTPKATTSKDKEPPKIGIQISAGELVNTARIESDGSVQYVSESILEPGKVCAKQGFQAACLNWKDLKNSYVHTPRALILIADKVISEGCFSANGLCVEARGAKFSGMIFCATQPLFRTREHLVIAEKSLVIVNGPAQFTSDLSAVLPGSILHHPLEIAWKTISIPPLLKDGKRFIPTLESKDDPVFTHYKKSKDPTQKGALHLHGELLIEVGNAQVKDAPLIISSVGIVKIDTIWQHSFFDTHGVFVWSHKAEWKKSIFTNNLLQAKVSTTIEQTGHTQSRVTQLTTGSFQLKPGARLNTDQLMLKADNKVEHEEKSKIRADQIRIYCSRLYQRGFLSSQILMVEANDLIYIRGELNSDLQVYTTPVFIRIGRHQGRVIINSYVTVNLGLNIAGQTDNTSILSINFGGFIQGFLQPPTWSSVAFALINAGFTIVNLFVPGSMAVTFPIQLGLNLLTRSTSAYGLGSALLQQTQRAIESPSPGNRIRAITFASRFLTFLACGALSGYTGFRSLNSRLDSPWHSPETSEILSSVKQSVACFAAQIFAGFNDNSLFAINSGFEGFLGRTGFHLGEIDFSVLAGGNFYENSLLLIDGRMGIVLAPSTTNSLISSLQGNVWVPIDRHYVNTWLTEIRPLLPLPLSSLNLQAQQLTFNATTSLQQSSIRANKVINHSNLTASNSAFSGDEFNNEAKSTAVLTQCAVHFHQENNAGAMQKVVTTDTSDAINVDGNGITIDDGTKVSTAHVHVAPTARYDARVSSLKADTVDNEGTMSRDYSTAEVKTFTNTGTYSSDESQNNLTQFTNHGKTTFNHSQFTGERFYNDGEMQGKNSQFSYDQVSGLTTGDKVKVENCSFYTNTRVKYQTRGIRSLKQSEGYSWKKQLRLAEKSGFNPYHHFQFKTHSATQAEKDNFSASMIHFTIDSQDGLLIYKTNSTFTLTKKEFYSLISFGFSAPTLNVIGAIYVTSGFNLFAQLLLLRDAQIIATGSVRLEAEEKVDANHSTVVSQNGSVKVQTPGLAHFVGSQLIANDDVIVVAGAIDGIEQIETRYQDNSRMVWRGIFSHWEDSTTQYDVVFATIFSAKTGNIIIRATHGPILLRGAQLQAQEIHIDAGSNPVLMPSAKGVEKQSVDGWGLTGYSNVEQQMESALSTTLKAHDIYIHGSNVTGSPILEAPDGSVSIDAKFIQLARDILHYEYTSTHIGLLEVSSPFFSHPIDPTSYFPLIQDLQQLCSSDSALTALANGLNFGMDAANTANPLLAQWLTTPSTVNNFIKSRLLNLLNNSLMNLLSINLRFGISRTQMRSERLDSNNTGITTKKLTLHAEQAIEFDNCYRRKATDAEYRAPTVIDRGAQLTTTVHHVEGGVGVNISLNGTVTPTMSVAVSESKDVTTVEANSEIEHLVLKNVQTYVLDGVQSDAKEVTGRPSNTIQTELPSSHEEHAVSISASLSRPSGEIFHKVSITTHHNNSTFTLTVPGFVDTGALTQLSENVQQLMNRQSISIPTPEPVKLSPSSEPKQLDKHQNEPKQDIKKTEEIKSDGLLPSPSNAQTGVAVITEKPDLVSKETTKHHSHHPSDQFSWLYALSPISRAEAAVTEEEMTPYNFKDPHSSSSNKPTDTTARKPNQFFSIMTQLWSSSKYAEIEHLRVLIRGHAPAYIKAVITGVKEGFVDTLKAPLYLLDNLAFSSKVNNDLRVIVYSQLMRYLFFPKVELDQFPYYRKAHHELAQLWSGIKTDVVHSLFDFIESSGSEKARAITHNLTTLLLPGSLLKLGRVMCYQHRFGLPSHPPLMVLEDGEVHSVTKGLEFLSPNYVKTHPGLYVYAITEKAGLLITHSEPTALVRQANNFSKSRTLIGHVDLTGGIPVLSAGEIKVSVNNTVAELSFNNKTGAYDKIKIIKDPVNIVFDNSSGHYKPQGKHLPTLVKHVAGKNGLTVEFKDVAERYHGHEEPILREVKPNLEFDHLLKFVGAADLFHSFIHMGPNQFYLLFFNFHGTQIKPPYEFDSEQMKPLPLLQEDKSLPKYYSMGNRSTFYTAANTTATDSTMERQLTDQERHEYYQQLPYVDPNAPEGLKFVH